MNNQIETKVWKYATGQTIPANAQFISTVVEVIDHGDGFMARYVWHYFQVPLNTKE